MERVFKKNNRIWMDAVQSKTACKNTTATANEHKSSELTKFVFVFVPPQYICFQTNTSLLVCVEEERDTFVFCLFSPKNWVDTTISTLHKHTIWRIKRVLVEKKPFRYVFSSFHIAFGSIQIQTHTHTHTCSVQTKGKRCRYKKKKHVQYI